MAACDPPAPPVTGAVPLSEVNVRAERFVSGLTQPIDLTRRADGVLYVAERAGRVRALTLVGPVTVLSIPGVRTDGERGLLGIEFSPDGSQLYVSYNDATGDVVLAEYSMIDGLRADAASRRVLLTIEHREYSNHNGGSIAVDAEGLIVWSTGDGGGGGDPHGNAQRLDTLAGKLLRIDPTPTASAPYTVPADNPYVSTPGARPEIWASGLRNPWRIGLDHTTGDLWIGDVGQGRREEINLERAPSPGGRNYGWNAMEGTLSFGEPVPGPLAAPLYEYSSDGTADCSITGGDVVRAATGSVAALDGAYLYGDWCSGRIGALRQRDGAVVEAVDRLTTVRQAVAFHASNGEAFVVSIDGTIWRLVA